MLEAIFRSLASNDSKRHRRRRHLTIRPRITEVSSSVRSESRANWRGFHRTNCRLSALGFNCPGDSVRLECSLLGCSIPRLLKIIIDSHHSHNMVQHPSVTIVEERETPAPDGLPDLGWIPDSKRGLCLARSWLQCASSASSREKVSYQRGKLDFRLQLLTLASFGRFAAFFTLSISHPRVSG